MLIVLQSTSMSDQQADFSLFWKVRVDQLGPAFSAAKKDLWTLPFRLRSSWWHGHFHSCGLVWTKLELPSILSGMNPEAKIYGTIRKRIDAWHKRWSRIGNLSVFLASIKNCETLQSGWQPRDIVCNKSRNRLTKTLSSIFWTCGEPIDSKA